MDYLTKMEMQHCRLMYLQGLVDRAPLNNQLVAAPYFQITRLTNKMLRSNLSKLSLNNNSSRRIYSARQLSQLVLVCSERLVRPIREEEVFKIFRSLSNNSSQRHLVVKLVFLEFSK